MLSCDQLADLAAALCATAETLGQSLSASAAELMAEDLAEYSVPELLSALKACRRDWKADTRRYPATCERR